MFSLDKERIRTAERAIRDLESTARQHRRSAKRKLQGEIEEDPDDSAYGAGMHWNVTLNFEANLPQIDFFLT